MELAWTQAWSGSPLYVMAIAAQGFWLHQHARFGFATLSGIAVLSTGLTLLASIILWGRFFAGESIMLWQVVNLPALIACLLIYPVVAVLIRFGFSE